MIEGRIIGGHDRLGHQRHHLLDDAPPAQLIAQRLEQHVADGTLGVPHDVIQWHRRHLVDGELRAPEDETDLRTVAMGQDQLPALLDQVDEVRRHGLHRFVLVGD